MNSHRALLIGVRAFAAGAAMLLSACAITPAQQSAGRESACEDAFRRVDEAVARAGVGDGMAARIPGFRYLRADRFLASFANEPLDEARFREWMDRMAALGIAAYQIEIANLPPANAHELAADVELSACATQLGAADRADPQRRQALKAAVAVPEEYAEWQRVAGVYWLTRIAFSRGVSRWHEEVRATFGRPLEALPMAGERRRYEPRGRRLAAAEVAALLERSSRNGLAIPAPEGPDLDALFATFAPAFVVDTAGSADLPGPMVLGDDLAPRIVPGSPVVYRRASHARYEGRALLQLNYWLWFPERPKRGAWDILGGRLDGLLWRVTLSPRGTPMVFDTIHPCGCYHLFFPTPRATAKPQPDSLDEPGFVPRALPAVEAGQRIELWLESGTHYLQRVVVGGTPGAGTTYSFADDDSLRSLPLPGGGRRSAFRPDGIVPGTERGERWLFWPMGVAEAGAMRQWGRHATAFVGRRHFDDPGLLSRYFDLVIMP